MATGFRIIPSLVQLVVVELIGTAALGAGVVARILDHFGLCGHPPVAPLTWGILGWLAVGGFFMWLTVRHIWNPGVTEEEWSPVRKFGPVSVVFAKDPSRYRYRFLGSHPAYVLMDFFAGLPSLVLTLYSWGDDPKLNPTMHVSHWWLIVWACIPAARLFCWYVLRRGPEVVSAMAEAYLPGASPAFKRKFEWENFWSGPLTFWIIALVAVVPALGVGIYQSHQYDKTIPPLTASVIRSIYGQRGSEVAGTSHADERFRIRGQVRGDLRHWPGGAGKYNSAGFVIAMDDGPEVAVFVQVHDLKRLEKLFAKRSGEPFTCLVRTLKDGGKEIPGWAKDAYDWSEADLGPVPEAAKSFTNTGRRILTYFVDP
jgi:hypothetical protein